MKVRVPRTMKRAFQALAAETFSSESEHARQAFIEYLAKRGVSLASLHEQPVQYKIRRTKSKA